MTLAAGSTPPWPGLAPWLSLISIILTCWARRLRGEALRDELAVRVAAAEIAAADLPDEVAAMLAVVAADAAFAGVVGEVAELGALVERAGSRWR